MSRVRQVAQMQFSPGVEATLYAVGFGIAISQFVLSSEAGVAENLIQVGGPIAIGGLVANFGLSHKPKTAPEYAQKGLIAGAVGVGVLMAADVLPVVFDAGTIGFMGLVGTSIAMGEIFATAIQW